MHEMKERKKLRLTDLFSPNMMKTDRSNNLTTNFEGLTSENSITFLNENSSLVSSLSKRLAQAMQKHITSSYKWHKQTDILRKARE